LPDDKAGLVAALFAYIDRPWKVAAVIVLVLVGGAAWVAYEKRDELVEAWLTPEAAELNTHDIPAALDTLIEESGAELVQIWAVDLPANSQRFLGARNSNGERPVIPSPRRLPIIVAATDLEALVAILGGHPACVDAIERVSPLLRRLADRGMHRVCGIPIPPGDGDAFVGVIYLAWRDAPDTSAEGVAIAAAREIAGKLVRR
jgi:hypothetical protein